MKLNVANGRTQGKWGMTEKTQVTLLIANPFCTMLCLLYNSLVTREKF